MKNLEELMAHIDSIYAPRNALVRSDLVDRMGFLNISVGKLYRAHRKKKKEEFGVRLANVFSRICCVAENFRGKLQFVQMLAGKYPMTHCTYCQKKPCVCEYKERKASVRSWLYGGQFEWTLSDWQKHFAEIYGEQNKGADRGPNVVLLQMFGEVTELLEVAEEAPMYRTNELVPLFSEELGDVFAWMSGFANLFDVNLEEAVVSIYGQGCPSCRQKVCECPIFRFKMDRANTTTP